MLRFLLTTTLVLLCFSQAIADVTVDVKIDQTAPLDADGKISTKVGINKDATFSVRASYNGEPPLNAEEKVTDQSWTYSIADVANVTSNPKNGTTKDFDLTVSGSKPGTYTITITMSVKLTIKKHASDGTTVVSTRESDEYTGTANVTIDVWGKLTITTSDFIMVDEKKRHEVKIESDSTLTEGVFTLTASNKLKLYENRDTPPFEGVPDPPSDSLSWEATTASKTYYMRGDSVSGTINDQTLTAKYSGKNIESTTKKVTVYDFEIDAPGKVIVKESKKYVPVMFNDDSDFVGKHSGDKTYTSNWDCATKCPTKGNAKCPDDKHRELEPVWDYLYIGEYTDDDLVECKVDIKPADMKEAAVNGEVKISSSDANIRIWKQKNKGDKGSIIPDMSNIPDESKKNYKASDLPLTVYVEGIKAGKDALRAEYTTSTGQVASGEYGWLSIGVVALIATQNGKQKIINANISPIKFTVEGGGDFDTKFTWTVSQTLNPGTTLGKNNTISLKYGETGCDVTLPEDAANRRFTSEVTVSIDGKLTLKRTVRVAQATYQGSPVKTTIDDRRIEVIGLVNVDKLPTGFDNTETPDDDKNKEYSQKWFEKIFTGEWINGTPPPVTINGNRLQYAPNNNNRELANTIFTDGLGSNRKVYAVFFLSNAYANGFKLEDIRAVAEHECQHVRQHVDVKKGGTNWRTLDDYYSDNEKYLDLREADAQSVELCADQCWKFMDGAMGTLGLLVQKYGLANAEYERLTPTTTSGPVNGIRVRAATQTDARSAAKAILQGIYKRIPEELQDIKCKDYDWSIRPPK
ncbi:MAG: hypothetical protein LBQ66_03110 [Planctomycetaceae bacterium]|jgi:hypothetical protein|nr:hypothetical protein [Planctomycetaceae bacterium]